jgi:AcrR family transcriptional regulator
MKSVADNDGNGGGPRTQQRSTPERIVDAGIELFSDRGYKGTTVGELEEAAGLTPRAGALYKHFPSKEAVLEAAFERHVAEIEALHSAIELMPLGDLRAELTLLTRFGMQMLVRERALRRIVITEGDRFPELKRRYQERIVDRSYEEAMGFISLKIAAGEFPDCDVEAVTVMMVGSLLGYCVEYDVFGRHPAGVDEDRFIEAVVDAAMALAERKDGSR